MMRPARFLRPLLPFATLLLAATVRADAPRDQYALFSADNVTIIDNYTGLTWSRAIQPAATHASAQTTCTNNVKDENGIGGFRMPTLKELLTLVDEGTNQDFQGGKTVLRAIDLNAFPKTPAAAFWAITRSDNVGGVPDQAYAVTFDTGDVVSVSVNATNAFHCVR